MRTSNMYALKPRARLVAGGRRALSVRGDRDFAKDVGGTTVTDDMVKTDRYVAMNRFKVKSGGAGPRFEQRWATRKSRLAELEGFRYFQLMRRVPRQEGEDIPSDEPNYVSFTIWDTRRDFQRWFKSDAFKEAHGGGTIFGFVDMLVNATFTLNGAPKPAFWHGLLPISVPGDMEGRTVEDGWRVVQADGKNLLPGETFVSANRFSVAEGQEAAFEQRWAARESHLKQMPGFKAFTMLRRDATAADDGFNYMSFTIWQDRVSFENWASSQAFSKSHGGPNASPKVGNSSSSDGDKRAQMGQLLNGPPSPAFYEGILVLESPQGA